MNCLLLVETLSTRRLAQSPIKAKDALRIYPDSFAFTSLLVVWLRCRRLALTRPLPSLSATGDDLGTTSAELGLATSVYLMSLRAPPLAYGTISDRVGRNPIVLFGCALVGIASLGFMLSISPSREPVLPLLQLLPLQLSGTSSTARPEAQRWPT